MLPDLELITIFDIVGVLAHVDLVELLGGDRADGGTSMAFTARTRAEKVAKLFAKEVHGISGRLCSEFPWSDFQLQNRFQSSSVE